ncbi:hypothetical protein [Paenibacillus sp. LPE1-1-1.1]
MWRLLIGFVAGVLYGAITTVEVPDGVVAEAAALLKLLFFH